MDAVHNDHLERSMRIAGYTPATLAAHFGLAEKTVRRWLTGRCLPYPTHQYAVAALLHVDRSTLWPEPACSDDNDLVSLYAGRNDIPERLWQELTAASGDVQLLSNDLNWFAEAHPQHVATLIARAHHGDRIHLALLDPDRIDTASSRSALEDAALSRRTLRQFDALLHVDRAVHGQIRLHAGSPLTILRFGSHMLVQPALKGVPAALSPTWHLRRANADGPFERYLAHVQQIWAHASLVPKHHHDPVDVSWPFGVTPDEHKDAPAGSSLARGRVLPRSIKPADHDHQPASA